MEKHEPMDAALATKKKAVKKKKATKKRNK